MSTKIEWCDETINPIQDKIKGKSGRGYHCTKISAGCMNCYAERINYRFGNELLFDNRSVDFEVIQPELEKPLRWKKSKRIFIQSMGDLFHSFVPNEFIDRVFAVMALSAQHKFFVLSKRPERMLSYLTEMGRSSKRIEASALSIGYTLRWKDFSLCPWPIPNVYLGVSISTNDDLWMVEKLLQMPSAHYFISHEPALGLVTYPKKFLSLGNRGWLVTGGETGPKARSMHPDIPRHDRDQCQAAGIKFYFKSWGEFKYLGWIDDGETMAGEGWERVGHKHSGHLLDGKEWRELP